MTIASLRRARVARTALAVFVAITVTALAAPIQPLGSDGCVHGGHDHKAVAPENVGSGPRWAGAHAAECPHCPNQWCNTLAPCSSAPAPIVVATVQRERGPASELTATFDAVKSWGNTVLQPPTPPPRTS